MLQRRLQIHAPACGILLLVCALGASAQDMVRFEHLTVDDGLSQNEVTTVLQDSRGFLWVGTSGGLNRYNGYEFAVFQFDPIDTTSISDNRITALLETADSTLWVGTADGLFRYDPESVAFTAYRHQPGNVATLAFNGVSALLEDASGQNWVGHASPEDSSTVGISRLDPHSGHVERLTISSDNDAVPVHAFAQTPDGTIWVGTADGLHRYDAAAGTFTTLRHDPAEPNSLAGNDIRELLVDSRGRLWVGHWGEGLDCYDPDSGDVEHHKPGPTSIDLSSGYISAIGQTSDGYLWVGTDNPDGLVSASLHRYDFKLQLYERFNHDPEREVTVGPGVVRAIVEDHAGVLWVATGLGGLSRFDQVTRFIPHYYPIANDPTSLVSPTVTAFLDDGKESIWVGTANGLDRFARYDGQFRHYRNRPGSPTSLSNNHVTALAGWRGDTLWVGTKNGLNRFGLDRGGQQRYLYNSDPEEGESDGVISDGIIKALYADTARNHLWIGTRHGLKRMDVRTGEITHVYRASDTTPAFSSNEIVVLYASEAAPNTLWVGTEDGLHSVDLESGEVLQYEADAGNQAALSHRYVTAISTIPADSNALWVGTLAGGLNRLDLETGTFKWFTSSNSGLPGNTINSIQPGDSTNPDGRIQSTNSNDPSDSTKPDGTNKPDNGIQPADSTKLDNSLQPTDKVVLWLGTNQGLVRFNTSPPYETRVYGVDSGVQSRQFNVGASYRTPRGEIVMGGTNGFNIFLHSDFQDNLNVPKVVLTGYRIDGEAQAAAEAILLVDELDLGHDQNDLTFDFVGLHFSRPEENRYRVRLERNGGESAAWRDLGTQRTATYANLTPGQYVFHVQAANSDGVWSEASASVRVRIKPPWWQTWWFRIFALVSVVGIAVFAYKRRIRRIAERNRELEALVTERTEELEQQTEALGSKNVELEATLGQLRTTQTQLVQAEKLASLGRMTAGVAHEIKNPLNFVNNFAELSEELAEELRTELASAADRRVGDVMDDVEPLLADLALNAAKIAEHGRRADGIVKSMLLHARGTSGDLEPTNLRTLLEESIDLVVHGSGTGGDGMPINIERDYDERIGEVTIVRQAIGRVILNLLDNAMYAMRERASSEPGYTPMVVIRTVDAGDTVRIEVEDNGPGIPEEVRARLFEPFFTTKPTGAGTGLGLSLVHDIIHSHHGEITVESTPGVGATFTIILPKKQNVAAGAD